MQKAILISIQPQHVLNILNGKKTLELRKSVPKDFKGWVYIYCTKSKPYLHKTEKDIMDLYPKTPQYILQDDPMVSGFDILNGHVIARFWYQSETYVHQPIDFSVLNYVFNSPDKEVEKSLNLEKTCLNIQDVIRYAGNQKRKLYVWEIEKLEVFDKPMKLSDFQKEEYAVMPNGVFPAYQPIAKAPQSWMFTYTNEQLP